MKNTPAQTYQASPSKAEGAMCRAQLLSGAVAAERAGLPGSAEPRQRCSAALGPGGAALGPPGSPGSAAGSGAARPLLTQRGKTSPVFIWAVGAASSNCRLFSSKPLRKSVSVLPQM